MPGRARPADNLLALIDSDRGDRDSAQTLPTLLHDAPVAPSIIEGITATARELAACTNAGDPRRLYALFSDDLIRAGVDLEPTTVEAAPVPRPPDESMAFLGVFYVRQLADGRAGAVVVFDDPRAPSPAEAFYWIFTPVGNRWIFDEFPDPFITEVETNVRQVRRAEATPEP